VSGYFCSVCGHVSKRWPLTLNQMRSSAAAAAPSTSSTAVAAVASSPPPTAGGDGGGGARPRVRCTADGRRVLAIGTQPIADARANGNHDATEAISTCQSATCDGRSVSRTVARKPPLTSAMMFVRCVETSPPPVSIAVRFVYAVERTPQSRTAAINIQLCGHVCGHVGRAEVER